MKSTILIVEDNFDNLKILYFVLKNNDQYNLLTARNTDEAEDKLNQNRVDIILLDVMMPNEDGFSFAKRIKSEDSDFAKIQIFLSQL